MSLHELGVESAPHSLFPSFPEVRGRKVNKEGFSHSPCHGGPLSGGSRTVSYREDLRLEEAALSVSEPHLQRML